jgi:hypothetical protein
MLIIYEMANNHGGDVNLGHRIIDEFSAVKDQFPQFKHCFKFQYRHIPTYIHPTADPNDKYVKRFRETNLSESDRIALKEHAEKCGFLAACTPFDEQSVRDIVKHGYNILKVGSPSFSDWGLWYEINRAWYGPVIASTGGATVDEIDRVVDSCKGRDLTLMHCVSEYPTKAGNMQFNQINWLRNRYPNIPIGYSSHNRENTELSMVACNGVSVIEKHVCLSPPPNEYSFWPELLKCELSVVQGSLSKCGDKNGRVPGPRPTQFMRQNIGGKMFWKPQVDVVDEIRAIIKKSLVVIPRDSKCELYHHLGMEKFRIFGATILTCFNRDYCKKLIVLLPKQTLPTHSHKIKEETFHLIYGDVDGLEVGQTLLILPGTQHSLYSRNGAVLEEISTRYLEGDSTYFDDAINNNKNRKTEITL